MITKQKIKWTASELFVVNILWCMLCIYWVEPIYDNSDDHLMNLLLFGGKGVSTPEVIFINILLSKILYILDKIFPVINWLSVLETILVVLFFIITSNLIKKNSSSRILTYGYIGLVAPYFYSHLTFSVAAMLGGFAGGLVIITELQNNKIRKIRLTAGIVILIISTMLREMAITGTILFFVIPAGECLYSYRKNLRLFLKKSLFVAISTLMALFFIREINQYYYSHWDSNYMEINSARAAVSDYPLGEWKTVKEELEKIGITENDYSLIQSKIFDDYEYFNADLLRKVSEVQISEEKNTESVLRIFSERKIWKVLVVITGLLIIAIWNNKKNRKKFLWKLILILSCLGIYTVYLQYIVGRFPRYVKDGFCGIVIALSIVEFSKYYKKVFNMSYRRIIVCFILGALIMVHVNYEWVWNAINHTSYKRQEYRDFFSEISKREDEFYYADLIDYFSEIYIRAFSVYEPIEDKIYNNYVRLSIWDREHPATNRQLENHGMENPFLDLIEENVYFMSDVQSTHYKLLKQYWKEHFFKEISYSMVEEFPEYGGIQIFKFQNNFSKYDNTIEGDVKLDLIERKNENQAWTSWNLLVKNCDEDIDKAYIQLETQGKIKTFMCEKNIKKRDKNYQLRCTFPDEEIEDNTPYSLTLILRNQKGELIKISNSIMVNP